MIENESQARQSFIEEPLLFFGNDVTFDYPPRYYDQIEGLEDVCRQSILSELEKNPQHADRFDELLAQEYEFRLRNIKHHLYEERFRGRYLSEEILNEHKETWDIIFAHENDKSVIEPPDTQRVVNLLNLCLADQYWYTAYAVASNWMDMLDDNNPDKAIAINYFGFAGGLEVNEYCRMAVALATPELANDDAVRVKHLFTICIPMVRHLEEYFPEEMASKKQLLREVFLEYAVQSVGGIRHYVEMLLPPEDRIHKKFKELNALGDNALTEFMRMESLNLAKLESFYFKLDNVVSSLVEQHKYYEAINLLDMACRAVDVPRDDISPRIDSIARQAIDHYTADMKIFDDREPPSGVVVDFTDYKLTNNERADMILDAPGITDEKWHELQNVIKTRQAEYLTTILVNAEGQVDAKAANDLIDLVASSKPESVQNIRQEHLDKVLQVFRDEAHLRHYSPGVLDRRIETLAYANVKNDHIKNELPSVMATIMDNLVELAAQDEFQSPIEYFQALISPILRGSKPTDNPSEEVVWRYISQGSLNQLFDKLEARYTNDVEELAFLTSARPEILADIRKWWKNYWEEVGEYSW